MIGSWATGGVPVAEIGETNLATKPDDGETIRNPMPLISANLSAFGQIDPGSVQMRVSGLGVVPASFDAKTNTASYQVTQKLRDRVSVVVKQNPVAKRSKDSGASPLKVAGHPVLLLPYHLHRKSKNDGFVRENARPRVQCHFGSDFRRLAE